MILVSGADSRLGRAVVQHLIAQSPARDARELALCVRTASRAADLAGRGVEVRESDFERPETLAGALAGVRSLVLIARSVRAVDNAIAAARASAVQHIVYIGFLDVAEDSPAECAAMHRAGEALVRASGMAATLLRLPLYADDLPALLASSARHGVLALPAGDGQLSLVSRDELARAIAAATLAPRLDRPVYALTGQHKADFATLAARIARVSGQPLAYAAVARDDYVARLLAQGLPSAEATARASLFTAIAAGKLALITHDYAALVGHPPKSLDCMIHGYFSPRATS